MNQFYFRSSFENKENSEKPFLNLKQIREYSDEKQEYEINIGDILKVGKLQMKVKDICINGKKKECFSPSPLGNISKRKQNSILNAHSFKKHVCRICYCDEEEVQSPLISPCKCSGGLHYIHFSCLQQWIKTKALLKSNMSNQICTTYSLTQINCEICKEPFPDFVFENGKVFEVFDFMSVKAKTYMILESVPKDKNETRYMHLLTFDENDTISIGRSHEVDLRITDITVSRFHAFISFNEKKGKFYFEDNNSKFGSLVLLQNNFVLISSRYPLSIQISNNLIRLTLPKGCGCCVEGFQNWLGTSDKAKRHLLYNVYGKINSSRIQLEKVFMIKREEPNEDESCSSSEKDSKKEVTITDEEHLSESDIQNTDKLKLNDNSEKYVDENGIEVTRQITNAVSFKVKRHGSFSGRGQESTALRSRTRKTRNGMKSASFTANEGYMPQETIIINQKADIRTHHHQNESNRELIVPSLESIRIKKGNVNSPRIPSITLINREERKDDD